MIGLHQWCVLNFKLLFVEEEKKIQRQFYRPHVIKFSIIDVVLFLFSNGDVGTVCLGFGVVLEPEGFQAALITARNGQIEMLLILHIQGVKSIEISPLPSFSPSHSL